MLEEASILWRRLDRPGYEAARLWFEHGAWQLAGAAVFAHDDQACRLDYTIICDSSWQAREGHVDGWLGRRVIDVHLLVSNGRWLLNGSDCPQVAGCVDLDLNFSPSTNLLPIRRLKPAVGQVADVRAAWLRFPSFTLEPLDQIYSRIDETTYRYESGGGSFITELQVNEAGLVVNYPNLCEAHTFTAYKPRKY